MLFAQQAGDAVFHRYHDAVFERFWRRALNIEDPDALATIISKAGADGSAFQTRSERSAAERTWAGLVRQEARGRMAYLLPPGTILCLPTTPFPAPKKGLPLSVRDPLRDRITCLCAQGGPTGVPQVNLPGATVDGAPVGVSIIGGRGSDATLLVVASTLAAS